MDVGTAEAALLAILAAALSAPSCATPGGSDPSEMPEVDTRELEEPPEPADGRVVAVPAESELTDEQIRILREVGVMPGWIAMAPSKAEAAAELRAYAESLYADASYNVQVLRLSRGAAWDRVVTLSRELDERNTWWNRNRGRIGLVAGWFLGSATTVLVLYGVNRASR